nr:helix-turn-helix domain-containing protein [Enterococcus pallens]
MEESIRRSELDSFLINYVPRRLLTQKEAVQYTGTSPGTINEWVKQGMKVTIFHENSRPKYDIRDLDKWIDLHKV